MQTSYSADLAIPPTSIRRVEADGVNVFYREAGAPDAPVILLLHGFPASSFQYRELIPRLADRYRVIAPDLPGFGFTTVPTERHYKYTLRGADKNHARLYRGVGPYTLCAVCVRLRCAYRFPVGHGSPGTSDGYRLAERQRLRGGIG